MFKIHALSKFVDLSKSIKLYYILAIGIFITILSFALYRDLLTTLVIGISTAAGFFIVGKPPKEITVQLSDESIDMAHDHFTWSKVIEWAMIDLGETVEIMLRTDNSNASFDFLSIGGYHYFYVDPEDEHFPEFVKIISLNAVYNEDLPEKDITHGILRYLGLV